MTKNDLLAFVHIEKAAGTSLIHILRRNFLLQYLDARPIRSTPGSTFTSSDLRLALRLNPFLKCIGGHSIKPYSDLEGNCSIRYVTLLRDPIKRYLSHYRYWKDSLKRDINFDEFLGLDSMSNFQTRKIAGVDDLPLAIHLLRSDFLLVGMVEKFDEFLVLLKSKLGRADFSIQYTKENVAKSGNKSDELAEKYRDEIIDRNKLDIELYEFVRKTIYPIYVAQSTVSRTEIQSEVTRVEQLSALQRTKSYLDYAYRKAYCEPASGTMRKINSRTYSGHY